MAMTPSTIALPTASRRAVSPSSSVSASTFRPTPWAAVRMAQMCGIWTALRRPWTMGMDMAMTPLRPARTERAPAWRWYPSASMLRRTRAIVFGEIERFPFST